MILLKANDELKTIFQRIVTAMDKNINWNETFFLTNNQLILPGNLRSLLFDFDRQKASSTVLDLPLEGLQQVGIKSDPLLENTLNMTLYAFGKWGQIKGMKVEKDFGRLNILINGILAQIDIHAGLTKESFRFYENGIETTYEEVVQKILDNAPVVEGNEEPEEDTEEYDIGLWHKILWSMDKFVFEKTEINQKEKLKYRLGNNFYVVNYNCPKCGEKMYLVIYPPKSEFRIDSPEGGVYLTRAYTCDACNMYFTAIPGKHLMEGDAYFLDFEDDKTAYRDYMEVLGKNGARTSNCNFNVYESDYNKMLEEPPVEPDKLEDALKNIKSYNLEEALNLEEKMDSGFYPEKSVEKYSSTVKKYIEKKHASKKNKENLSGGVINEKQETKKLKASEGTKKKIKEIIHEDNEHFAKRISNLNIQQLKDFQELILSEDSLTDEDRSIFQEKIDRTIYKDKVSVIEEKVSACKGRNYSLIIGTINEIKRGAYPESLKTDALKTLHEMAEVQGKKELESIIINAPKNIDKSQYKLILDKINSYSDIENSTYKKTIEDRWDEVEVKEIKSIIRALKPRDRRTYFDLYQRIKEKKFENRNSDPYMEKIYKKLTEIDNSTINRIYSNKRAISFLEGLKAYDEISTGTFLPELKSNTLEMIDKRLTKMKMEECDQLVGKLRKELPWLEDGENGIYFYSVKRPNTVQVQNAINRYGVLKGKYEYPIIINDYTSKKTGLKGFILTPDHVFYSSGFSSGAINIESINEIADDKNIFINLNTGEKIKIKTRLSPNQKRMFANSLNEFVTYLIEKPESRSVSYMAEERHPIKCCYRCGNIYRDEEECPRCGAKFND